MSRSRVHKPISRALRWPLLVGALVAGSLASCDNPACVFSTSTCQTLPGGGANQVSSTFAETGEWVVPVPPTIQAVYPSGFAKPESPVVIVFSETVSPATIDGAFAVRTTSGIGGGAGSTVVSALVGDGRVLILAPAILVGGQEYEVVLTEEGSIQDLSGALLSVPEDGVVHTFSVDSEPSPLPQLVMSWPGNGTVGQSPITEIVTVFDRIIDPLTVTTNSWNVQVDGADPTFNPRPEILSFNSGAGGSTQDPRVWTWKSIDPATEERAELGIGAMVEINLSTSANPGLRISTLDGDRMDPITPTFTTSEFSMPTSLEIVSEPSDAIGIENLSPTGMRPLMLSVDFPMDAVAGDVLEIFIVGTNPPDPNNADAPRRISRQREFALTPGPGPFLLEQEDLGLLASTMPLASIFDDDDISFAFALRRGALRTPVRVLDVDLTEPGIQDAFIDLSGLDFINLIGKEEGDLTLVSNLRELSISGFGSQEVRSVEVVAHLMSGDMDNLGGMALPPLPIYASNGAFVAAPVHIGQQEFGETNFLVDIVIYDRALNPSPPVTIDYTQIGSSGVGMPIASGNDIDITVFDSQSLAPISGALVYRHESVGGVLTPTVTGVLMTGTDGTVAMPPAPGGDTLITVEAAGYDLFTFQAVPTTRLDVPLVADTISLGLTGMAGITPGSSLTSTFLHAFSADSRVILPGDTVRESTTDSFNPLVNTTISEFPQVGASLGEVGLATLLATKDPSDLFDPDEFSASTFLQAWELEYPRDPLGPPPPIDVVGIQAQTLLSGAEVDPADTPLGVAGQVFNKPPNYALDFPNPSGDPRVSVEALTWGVPGMMTIGMGLPYFNGGGDNWDIRAAYTARAKAAGELATDQAIEDERLLRVEIVDASGNRTGVRQPMSTATGDLDPIGVPLLTSPLANSGGEAYDLVYENVITAAYDLQGLYHVVLVDSIGRRWHFWTPDAPDGSGAIVTHVPPIGLQGGTPLTNGVITAVIEAWAWTGFDPGAFMYSDIDRRHEPFTVASPKVFSQP